MAGRTSGRSLVWLQGFGVTAVLVVLLGLPHPARAQDPLLVPLVLRLEGVGAIYGLAGGVRNLSGDGTHIVGGAVTGDVRGKAAALLALPLGLLGGELSFVLGDIDEAHLTTSYTRGIAPDRPVEQSLSGRGAAALLTLNPIEDVLAFRLGTGRSVAVFGEFRDGQGEVIPLPGANLHDVETTHLLADVTWRVLDAPVRARSGFELGAGWYAQTGRAGQSDVAQTSLRASGYVPLGGRVTWALHARKLDARVLKAADAYDTPAEVAAELGIDCAQAGPAGRQVACQALADDLADYIAASNRHGTATPLGGSTTLRAYREARFRAAHVRLLATELRVHPSPRLDLALFLERGQAADVLDDAGLEPRDAYGLGLRFWFGEVPARLEGARGDEGSAWFLTLGLPW